MLATRVSVEEYLRTNYDPDRDYVDGVLEERNLGQRDHSRLQILLGIWFWQFCQVHQMRAYSEQRLKIGPAEYRIPDVCVMKGSYPAEQIFSEPPYICIEILSPEDRIGRLQERVNDYARMGVRNIWVIDPVERLAWTADSRGLQVAPDGVLVTNDGMVTMSLAAVYALDD